MNFQNQTFFYKNKHFYRKLSINFFKNILEKNQNEKMSEQKNLEPDLDFLRYADDVRESKSLKKFIDSGKEKRFRIRTKEIRLEIKIRSIPNAKEKPLYNLWSICVLK